MRHTLFVATISVVLTAPYASAQMPTLDPSGRPKKPAAEPAPPPGPAPVIVNLPGAVEEQDGTGKKKEAADTGFYYRDDVETTGDAADQSLYTGSGGPVPETHVILAGDTLWDICSFYFNNPWEWPRIWSYNPTINNPHWIYPGDIVRLYEKNDSAVATGDGDGDGEDGVVADVPTISGGISLKYLAFLDAEELKDPFYIDGAVEEKLLLSDGDAIYLRYGDKKPEPGKKYSVYEEIEKVVHPKTGKAIGTYVRIRGDLNVQSARKDRRARATLTRSDNVIERGMKVGDIRTVFGDVKTRRNAKTLEGIVTTVIGERELVGSRQLIIINKGKNSGVEVGNRFFAIRRGDAYPEKANPLHQVGLNDKRFPARAIGQVIVVEAGKDISLTLVTSANREIGVGDMVLMKAEGE